MWSCIDFMGSMSCSQLRNLSVGFQIYSNFTIYYLVFCDGDSEKI